MERGGGEIYLLPSHPHVQQGRVRLVDQQGNAEADTAVDFGRRHQSEILIDARRKLLQARSHWYPVMLDLHRFMIAVAGVSVNHDGKGGTAPDLLVWDQGGRRKVRRTDIRINVDRASLPGFPGFSGGPWIQIHGGAYQKDTSRCIFAQYSGPGPGASNPEEMEKNAPPLPPKERGVRWARLAIFFLDLGLGEDLCLGKPGTCLRREQA